MLFSEVVGQVQLKKDLKQLILQDKFPHAMMFVGNEGWGTLPMALAFVQYLMCTEKTDDDACGQCSNCMKIQKFEHPDLRASYPTIITKPGAKNIAANYIDEFRAFIQQTPYGSTFDWLHMINTDGKKQGNISADECREIIEGMNLKAYEGGYKVHIVWRPEYLEKEGNRLLKLIEEPPANTLLIFVASEVQKILPTLLSRMQAFKLKPLNANEIAEALSQHKAVTPAQAAQVANIANGSYAEALVQLNDWENEALPSITNILNAVYSNNGLAIHEWVEKTAELSKEGIRQQMLYMQMLFSTGFRTSIYPQTPIHLPEADTQFVHKLVKLQLPINSYEYIDSGINQLIYHIGRNANVKVQLLHFCIQMQYWIKGRQLIVQ